MRLFLEAHQIGILRRHGLGESSDTGLHGVEPGFLFRCQETQQVLAPVFEDSVLLGVRLVILALHHIHPDIKMVGVHHLLDHLLFELEQLVLHQVAREHGRGLVRIGLVIAEHVLIGGNDGFALRNHFQHKVAEVLGELAHFGVGTAAGFHRRIPTLQIGMELLGFGEVIDPAAEGFRIELFGFRCLLQAGAGAAENGLADGHHVFGNLGGESFGDANGARFRVFGKSGLGGFDFIPLILIGGHILVG